MLNCQGAIFYFREILGVSDDIATAAGERIINSSIDEVRSVAKMLTHPCMTKKCAEYAAVTLIWSDKFDIQDKLIEKLDKLQAKYGVAETKRLLDSLPEARYGDREQIQGFIRSDNRLSING
jgi:hypothetical protein